MSRLQWSRSVSCPRLTAKIKEEWFVLRLTLYSLCYNSLSSTGTMVDTVMEPLFWCVDHFVRYLGPVFVVMVVVLTSSVVVIFYLCLLPHKIAESYFWTGYHLVFGHWLLINIAFHYYRAAFTPPGHPPETIPEMVGICKKCVSPKPPRSHHCSVCGHCVLKMDHHCPWVNNCVGHYNHRYFFLYCVYMCVGCIYVCVSAYPLFVQHFYGTHEDDVGWAGMLQPFFIVKTGVINIISRSADGRPIFSRVSPTRSTAGLWFHTFIIYEFMLCSAAAVSLACLLVWHTRLVHRAETSIEAHTNRVEANRLAQLNLVYRNPYDFGALNNWRIFLGLTHGRSFWRHVLLPSSHAPDGDGLTWKTIYRVSDHPDGVQVL